MARMYTIQVNGDDEEATRTCWSLTNAERVDAGLQDSCDIDPSQLLDRKTWFQDNLVTLRDRNICLDEFSFPRDPFPFDEQIYGRGRLDRFGPNHVADVIVTYVSESNLQNPLVLVYRDIYGCASPSSFCDALTLTSVNNLKATAITALRKVVTLDSHSLIPLICTSPIVYCGYDHEYPDRTLNAWVERTVFHVSLSETQALNLPLQEGCAEWMPATPQNLCEMHCGDGKYVAMALRRVED